MTDLNSYSKKRRTFLKQLTLAGIGSQILLISSCSSTKSWPESTIDWLKPPQIYLIDKFQNILFPNDGNGPSCREINTFEHLLWTYSELNSSPEERNIFIQGIDKIDTIIRSYSSDDYRDISQEKWEIIVDLCAAKEETTLWVSKQLNIILEALTQDPIYNVNTNEIGWDWLDHQPGFPRPSESLAHPIFYQKN